MFGSISISLLFTTVIMFLFVVSILKLENAPFVYTLNPTFPRVGADINPYIVRVGADINPNIPKVGADINSNIPRAEVLTLILPRWAEIKLKSFRSLQPGWVELGVAGRRFFGRTGCT